MRKTKPIRFLLFFSLIFMFLQTNKITPQNTDLKVDILQTPGTFPLVHNGKGAKILFDSDDAMVVRIAAENSLKNHIMIHISAVRRLASLVRTK